MKELRKFVCPEFIFGSDAIDLAGQYCTNWCAKKVLLVSDKIVKSKGWVDKVVKSLEAESILYSEYLEVQPNPRDYNCHDGLKVYHENNCDVIIAVGGGSVIDAAKGIGILVSNKGNILDYEGVDKIEHPMPPLICIPTTSGSSADVSQFAIITASKQKRKIAIISKAVVPDLSLVDPRTLLTMDRSLTIATCLDTLTHAIEAYVSLANSFMTDRHALGAIGLVGKYLPLLMKDIDNLELRTYLMQASLEAGLAFSNASLGLVHAMAHALGGLKDMPHGECNGILLKNVCKFNYDSCPERYDQIAKTLGSTDIIDAIDKLVKTVGLDPRLEPIGLSREDFIPLAQNALNDACLATNPKPANLEDIVAIYEETF
ncbi:MAG: iron-containing alcohol dehydrogenase [Spirochaetaceae bacterium]